MESKLLKLKKLLRTKKGKEKTVKKTVKMVEKTE